MEIIGVIVLVVFFAGIAWRMYKRKKDSRPVTGGGRNPKTTDTQKKG